MGGRVPQVRLSGPCRLTRPVSLSKPDMGSALDAMWEAAGGQLSKGKPTGGGFAPSPAIPSATMWTASRHNADARRLAICHAASRFPEVGFRSDLGQLSDPLLRRIEVGWQATERNLSVSMTTRMVDDC
jgi:hypothetical protein